MEVIKSLGSYTELSQSGNGAHVIARASLPDDARHKTDSAAHGGGLEVYDRGRFFVVTGVRVPGTKARIAAIDPAPVLSAIGGSKNGTTKSTPKFEGSRHNYLIHEGYKLADRGLSREQAYEILDAIAQDIGLPKREQDEVKRIVDWLYDERSEEARIRRIVENKRIQLKADKRLSDERAIGTEAEIEDILDGDDFLAQPERAVKYIIDPVMPTGANVML